MACEGGGSNNRSSYYNVLGIREDASVSDIRTAYRKLAMVLSIQSPSVFDRRIFVLNLRILVFSFFLVKKWHPDRYARNPGVAGEAKRRFQQIQEAYSGNFTFFFKNILLTSVYSCRYLLTSVSRFFFFNSFE